jgi:hypothetical protein
MDELKASSAAGPRVGFVSLGCAKALTDSELKRRRRAEGDFPNSSWVGLLELPKGKNCWGVNLKNWGMA